MAEVWKRGAFSKVFRLVDGTVKIFSSDPVKECMALWGFGESALWPEIERTDRLEDGTNVFIMPLYDQPRSLKSALMEDDYKIYLALRKASKCLFLGRNPYDAPQHWHKTFENDLQAFPEVMQAMHDAIDSLQNYGHDIRFEISPRNVAVKNGRLILLDCFFFASALANTKKGNRHV